MTDGGLKGKIKFNGSYVARAIAVDITKFFAIWRAMQWSMDLSRFPTLYAGTMRRDPTTRT